MSKLEVIDASQIITTEQHGWVNQLRMEPVIVNQELTIMGTKDTGADLHSIREKLFQGKNVL